jgi:hypothetical protein
VKKPLAALLVSAATVAALAVPAGAAVPKTAATDLVPCGKKVARIWNTGSQVAAKNPCSKWLVLQHTDSSQSDPSTGYISVAPGAQFSTNLAWNDPGERFGAFLDRHPHCDGSTVRKNGRLVNSPPCQ